LAHVATIAILQQNTTTTTTGSALMHRLEAAVTSRGVVEMVKGCSPRCAASTWTPRSRGCAGTHASTTST